MATRLQRPDGSPADAWECDHCKTLWCHAVSDYADVCCKCKRCGKVAVIGLGVCAECAPAHQAEWLADRRAKSFEAAKKVPEAEYAGTVVVIEGHLGDLSGDGYFSSVEAVREYCESEGVALPEYVWGTQEIRFTLCAGEIVDERCEQLQLHEGAIDNISRVDLLQWLMDTWIAESATSPSYMEDRSVAVMLAPAEQKAVA